MSDRSTFLTPLDFKNLNDACIVIEEAFPESYGTFLIGSAKERPDFRDVDVRLILPDDEFDRMFKERQHLWSLTCLAVSAMLGQVTRLPVDFQVQRATEANEKFPDPGKRNPMGKRARPYAGGGDATRFDAAADSASDAPWKCSCGLLVGAAWGEPYMAKDGSVHSRENCYEASERPPAAEGQGTEHRDRIVAWVEWDGDEYHNFVYQTHDPRPSEVERFKRYGYLPLGVMSDGPSAAEAALQRLASETALYDGTTWQPTLELQARRDYAGAQLEQVRAADTEGAGHEHVFVKNEQDGSARCACGKYQEMEPVVDSSPVSGFEKDGTLVIPPRPHALMACWYDDEHGNSGECEECANWEEKWGQLFRAREGWPQPAPDVGTADAS